MKAVVTRVNSASVSIDGSVCGRIGKGFLILLGVAPEDTPEKCRKLAEKILGLRVFRDENDKMNLSLSDVSGEVLVVSQFTLYGDVSPDARASSAPESPTLPFRSTSSFCPNASGWASRRSTASSAHICRSRPKTTDRLP